MSEHFSIEDQYRAWYLRLSQIAQEILSPYSLKTPLISFSSDLDKTLGKWLPKTYEIRLALRPFYEYPWSTCINIFKHELAHLIADKVYQGKHETAHGPSFQKTCRELGISSETALRNPQKQLHTARKIKKLLKYLSYNNSIMG